MHRRTLLVAPILLALCLALPAAAAPRAAQARTITLASPDNGQVIGDQLEVIALVWPPTDIAFVVATVGERSAQLTLMYDYRDEVFHGLFSLAELPHGPFTVTVAATDRSGAVVVAQATPLHDTPPALDVALPLEETVAQGSQVDVRAACVDDAPAGCHEVALAYTCAGPPIIAGTASISATATLTATGLFAPIALCLRATDSAGQTAEAARRVYLNTPAALLRHPDIDGELLDLDPSRLLLLRQSPAALLLVDRASGAEAVVSGGSAPAVARLVPGGVVFATTKPNGSPAWLYHWSEGITRSVGPISSPRSLSAAGAHISWFDQGYIFQHDLVAGATITIAAQHVAGGHIQLPDGDIIYFDTENTIRRYSHGQHTVLIAGTIYTSRSGIATDGTTVIYKRCEVGPISGPCGLYLLEDGQETQLYGGSVSTPDAAYAINNGWIAYGRPNFDGTNQIWRRSPDGLWQAVTPADELHTVTAIGPDGTLVWDRSLLNRPGQPTLSIGGPTAPTRVFISGGSWDLLLGRAFFSILSHRLALPALPH